MREVGRHPRGAKNGHLADVRVTPNCTVRPVIDGRARTRLACALALAAAALAVVAPPALAVNWTIKGSLANTTGSTANNCPVGGGTGCVLLGPNKVAYDDASNVVLPPSPIPPGGTGSFSFQAEGALEGADMYALYTLPDGSTYE